jgi:hypothetical protein
MAEYLPFILKTITSVLLIYYFGNTIFKYHLTMNRVSFFFIVAFVLQATFFYESENLLLFGTIVVVNVILYLISLYVMNRFKRHGYLMFHVFPRQYELMNDFFKGTINRHKIEPNSTIYCKKKPFLILFIGIDRHTLKPILKELEDYLKKNIAFFWLNSYVTFVLTLILLAAIWRY